MRKFSYLKSALAGGASLFVLATAAHAESFNIPGGDLESALNAYASQTGVALIVSDIAVKGAFSKGVRGELTADAALSRILEGTGFTTRRTASGAVGVVHEKPKQQDSELAPIVQTRLAAASTAAAGVESVIVTSSKIKGDIQTVPISITALSQEQLTARQIAGGPDLVREIPNFNFSKTNFSGFNIEIRGIGTQAVSVTTDPAVAVAFNDTAFLRNHFFEQEFFDVSQVEVLRGPQGTLYGRNATAGVVNIVSAKATDQFEVQGSIDVGNYNNRRLEGMINIPLVSDKLDLRLAGEWTKRDGYDYNSTTQHSVNGRDLWSGRVTVSFQPFEKLHGDVVWEHFSENDDRSRTGKQLCTHDSGPASLGPEADLGPLVRAFLSQGCLPGSLYAPAAFGTPNGLAIPFVLAASEGANQSFQTGKIGNIDGIGAGSVALINAHDPYGGMMQSPDLHTIASIKDPKFRARNDTLELNADYDLTPTLTFTSQTGYNKDMYYSTQDYNRFNTVPVFNSTDGLTGFFPSDPTPQITPGGIFCDPQIGCSNSIAGFDISQAKSWQFNQEIRLQSSFTGSVNFSVGANYTHYRTVEDYYVLFNVITALAELPSVIGNWSADPTMCGTKASNHFDLAPILSPECAGSIYIDPNPLDQINGQGHNYFRSDNPYSLNSFAGFGEVYWQAAQDLKIIGGLRYTVDHKRFTPVPSQTLLSTWRYTGGTVDVGYPELPDIKQHWGEFTGRFGGQWTPTLSFTDQSMVYAFYSRGYKGGGANPPGIGFQTSNPFFAFQVLPYPATFEPEFVNAYELGSKNTLLDGSLTLNGDVFFYDYKNYQVSQIKARTAVNENFNAHVWGSEVEATWEPAPGLRFNFAGGYEGSRVGNNQFSLDLMNRTQGNPDYVILKPFLTLPSNCVVQKSVVEQYIQYGRDAFDPGFIGDTPDLSASQFLAEICPGAGLFNFVRPIPIDPSAFPNDGAGFFANVGGKKLPNTPPFTLSLGAQYSMPLGSDWAATLRGDGYWQGNSYARIYNDKPYDKIRGYTNLNLTLILTSQDGLQIMAYAKNVFDTTAITGTFLNSDDTDLTTNIFTTDPRLLGLRVTKSL